MKHTEIKEGILWRSQIHCTALKVPDELDDLNELMRAARAQEPSLRDAPTHLVMEYIRNGRVDGTTLLSKQGGENRILRAFYVDFFARLKGSVVTPSANQTLFIEYLGIGTDYSATDFNQLTLGNEIYRDVPDEFYDDGISTFYSTLYLKKSEANPTADTTLTAGTTTTVTVTSPTGFVEDGRIEIETANNTYNCTITNIAGSVFTVSAITGGPLTNASAFDPSDIPDSGDTIIALHSEASCFIGGAATSSPDTGSPMNRKRIQQKKNDSISLLYDYILACASLD